MRIKTCRPKCPLFCWKNKTKTLQTDKDVLFGMVVGKKRVAFFLGGCCTDLCCLTFHSFMSGYRIIICSPKMFGPSVYVESSRNRPNTPMKGNL